VTDSGFLLFLLAWFLVAAAGVIYEAHKLTRRGRR
jgi:hypothetical protein